MAPPSAIDPPNGDEHKPNTTAPLEPGIDEKMGNMKMIGFPKPPKFDDPYKERAYLKGRLAAAFRIFGKYGFDEGVAGHITLRVGLDHNLKTFKSVKRDTNSPRTPLTQPPSG